MKNDMILILGVTASGKGKLAFELAKQIGAEIISIDSMKVYRRMDIGTAKPPQEARRIVSYHLIDIVEPDESFSAGMFLKAANASIEEIKGRNKSIVAVGGTAFYIKALLYGLFEGPGSDSSIRSQLKQQAAQFGLEKLHEQLRQIDPVSADRIHPNDEKRIIRALEVYQLTGSPISGFQQQWGKEPAPVSQNWKIIGLQSDKTLENQRINSRVKKIIDSGLIDEVKALLSEEKPLSKQARCAIGYAEIIDYLEGKIGLDDAIEQIKINTRRLAKHQRTWFKRFKNVHWLEIKPDELPENIFERLKVLSEAIY